MPKETLSVTVMGTGTVEPLAIELERSFFEELAEHRLAKFTPTPPPFVAPCSDGVLVIYNVIRNGIGISGEAASFRGDALTHHPALHQAWEGAKKPMSIQSALLYFGFPVEKS